MIWEIFTPYSRILYTSRKLVSLPEKIDNVRLIMDDNNRETGIHQSSIQAPATLKWLEDCLMGLCLAFWMVLEELIVICAQQ